MWLLIYCYQKDLSAIKTAAYWGVLGIVSFLFLDITDLLIRSWNESIPEDRPMNFVSIDFYDYNVYTSIATIILSFNIHTYTFSIYECMDSPDARKMIVTSSIGIFTSTLIYLLVGTIGYILYGNQITDSILDSMGYNNISILMCISFVVNVVMSFPITFNSLKHYFIFLVQLCITLLKDSCCKSKKKDNVFLTNHNETNVKVRNQELLTKDNETKIENEDEANESVSEDEDEGDFDEPTHHVSHVAHHKMIEIPEYIEFIIVSGLFFLIFYTANKFPDIKTVKLLALILFIRFSDFSELRLRICVFLFYQLCFS